MIYENKYEATMRDYMLFSPFEDEFITYNNIRELTYRCLYAAFVINLRGFYGKNSYIGLCGLIRIERPRLKEDIQEISHRAEQLGLKFNKELNTIGN